MHLSDALISPAVAGTMYAASALLLAESVQEIKRDFKDSRIPLMGVAGAFIFAAQMINFSIPGTGSSGHICGAVLLSVLFGSAPAFIIMSGVLLIQALFFADGGLLAYGCNLFNMAFFGSFLAGPYIFNPIAGDYSRKWRVIVAGILSGMTALVCGAFTVTLQTLLSGITELPFPIFITFMLPIHAVIGFAEGLATAFVILFIRKNLPQITSIKTASCGKPALRAISILALSALVMAGGLSLFASSNPDGLEWSIEETSSFAKQQNPLNAESNQSESHALFADYNISPTGGNSGAALAGIIGCILFIIPSAIAFYSISRLRRRHSNPENFHG